MADSRVEAGAADAVENRSKRVWSILSAKSYGENRIMRTAILGQQTNLYRQKSAMPKLTELIAAKNDQPYVAFEYFPPRTADGVASLCKRFKRMASQGAFLVPRCPHTRPPPPLTRPSPLTLAQRPPTRT